MVGAVQRERIVLIAPWAQGAERTRLQESFRRLAETYGTAVLEAQRQSAKPAHSTDRSAGRK